MTRVFFEMALVAKTPHPWIGDFLFSIISGPKNNALAILYSERHDARNPHRVGTDPVRLHACALNRNHTRMPPALPRVLRVRRRPPQRTGDASTAARLQGTGFDRPRPCARRSASPPPRVDRGRRAAGSLSRAE